MWLPPFLSRRRLLAGSAATGGALAARAALGQSGHGVHVTGVTVSGVQATIAAMRFARELRADVVVNRVGRVPEDEGDARFVRLVEALTAIGSYGDRVGTRLAAQTGGERPHDLLRLLRALPEQTVGVDLHPTGLILGGQSPRDAVDLLGPYVLHVHACDAIRDAAGRANEVELGRGSAELPELLGQLTEFDYRGWVTIERRDSSDPIAEIENAVAFLRAL